MLKIAMREAKRFGLFILFLVAVTGVYAQTDATAKALLDKMSSTYKGYKTVQANFTVTARQSPQAAADYSESGVILIEPSSGKYHITMDSQELISDGKTLWTVLKDVSEVQVTDVDNSATAISPVNIFSFYSSGYKYVSAADERAGNTALHVIELSPEDTQSPYYKIKLRINQSTNLLYDVTVFDKNGMRYTYAIKGTKANPTVPAGRFTFQQSQYPGVEIVDLR